MSVPARDVAVGRPAGGTGTRVQPSRPPLRVVQPRTTPPRAPFVILVALLLGGGLVAVLLVNTWLAQGSFEIRRLQAERTAVQIQAQALARTLAAESAPGALAAKAVALGLVPAPNPVFKTAAGAVLGTPNKAVRPAPPPPPPTPSAPPSASTPPSTSASPSGSASASTPASPSASGSPSASAAPAAKPGATPAPAAKPGVTAAPSAKPAVGR